VLGGLDKSGKGREGRGICVLIEDCVGGIGYSVGREGKGLGELC